MSSTAYAWKFRLFSAIPRVAATNAAITALAKAFAEQGIKDVQVNSIVPGPVITGRRRSFLEKWAPAHIMSVEQATKQFPEEAGISRYGDGRKRSLTSSHSWYRPQQNG